MKNTVVLILAFFAFSFINLQAQSDDPAIMALDKAITQFFAHDNAGYASNYTAEGILVNPLGMVMIGPDAIMAGHEPLFNIYWKDLESHSNVIQKNVRYLADDLAIVSITADTWHTKEGEEVDRYTAQVGAILKQHGGSWMIEYFHVTPVKTPGQG